MSATHERDSAIALEAARDFYGKLTLGDVYGCLRQNRKKIPVTFDQYQRFISEEGEQEKKEYARVHGVENIGSIGGGGGDGFFIDESISTDKLAEWVPHVRERELILQVAHAVADSDKKPSIVEIGCGTGLVSNLLGLDQQARVLGVDIDEEVFRRSKLLRVPDTTIALADVWDLINQVGPGYSPDIAAVRAASFAAVKDRTSFNQSDFFGNLLGDEASLTDVIGILQSLPPLATQPSSTDLVVCSFMHERAELTIPIRDGISPKAIMYVRPTNGKSGAGDYYYAQKYSAIDIDKLNGVVESIDPPESEDAIMAVIGPNTHISFNPGSNYLTVARWSTPWNNDHDLWKRKFNRVSAEGVVQVRKDVLLQDVSHFSLRMHAFDRDIENAFREKGQKNDFLAGIEVAKAGLRSRS